MPSSRPGGLLVLGLGNVLCGDDGLGAVAAFLLAERYQGEGVRILDGGTLGLSLLPYLEDALDAILVDAIRADAPPGSLVRLEGDDVAPAVAARLSPHQVGVADLLDGARWRERLPARLVLVGLVPEALSLGLALSPVLRARLPQLLDAVVDEAGALGYALAPRLDHDPGRPSASRALAAALGL
jgi:hydrogenase maturation protease